jgi:hypothetical protein
MDAKRRSWSALAGMVLVAVALTVGSASAAPPPSRVGAFTAPFEEGGSATPRCKPDPNGPVGQVVCKPTAAGAAVLPDGKVWYANAIEAGENVRYTSDFELAPRSRDSLSRILDLRSGTPLFSIPSPAAGGASNPNINPGSKQLDDPNGFLGVPGQPGDGLSGSTWGMLGLPPSNATDPPDDVQMNDGDMFCSDQAQLADGRLLIAGGTDWYNEPSILDRDKGDPADVGIAELEGLRVARIYNPSNGTYTQAANMKFGRWYPDLVTLPDGRVSVFGGVTKLIKDTQGSQVRRTETYDPSTNVWTENYVDSSSEATLPLFARMFLMPNGKILYTGVGQTWAPEGQAVDEILWGFQQFWNPATSKWERIGMAPLGAIGGAPVVMLAMNPPYNKATVMSVGGTLLPTPGTYFATPFTTLTTVTKSGAVTAVRGPNLNNRRWFSSAVTLPDGKVLTVSGAGQDEVLMTGFELPVHQAELYDPVKNTWTPMASGHRDRTYHNSAILLPDGRVLVGGHSPIANGVGFLDAYGANHDVIPGVTANNDRDPSFEVYSPPYLYKGARPKLTGVRSGIKWDTTFPISTPTTNITQVVLSRLPSAQHVTDTDARTIRLAFTSNGDGTLTAKSPPNGVIAPPGYYYLFILNGSGVPSVARIVHIGDADDNSATVNPYGSDDPPPPDTSIGATPDPDSSYINQPPPLPVGAVALGMVAAGAGVPARRRRREDDGD